MSVHEHDWHPNDDGDMCPNCVTPWKCNGPHQGPRRGYRLECDCGAVEPMTEDKGRFLALARFDVVTGRLVAVVRRETAEGFEDCPHGHRTVNGTRRCIVAWQRRLR